MDKELEKMNNLSLELLDAYTALLNPGTAKVLFYGEFNDLILELIVAAVKYGETKGKEQ